MFLLLITISTTSWALPKILVIGDSLAAGYGIDIQHGWVALIQKQLANRYQVINAGISGDTTANGLARLPEALQRHQPKIVVLELGGNDGLRGVPIAVIKNNLEKMIRLAKKSAQQVVLVGVRIPPNYGPQYTQQFQNIYLELAKKYSLPIVPFLLKNVDDQDHLMQADRIHPTQEAQSMIFENVWQVLHKYV